MKTNNEIDVYKLGKRVNNYYSKYKKLIDERNDYMDKKFGGKLHTGNKKSDELFSRARAWKVKINDLLYQYDFTTAKQIFNASLSFNITFEECYGVDNQEEWEAINTHHDKWI
mgnify:CR=1 FL=1